MRKRFPKACKKRFMPFPQVSGLRYHLKRAAGLGDLFLGGGAKSLGVNGELGLELAIAENLDRIRGPANKAVRTEKFGSNRLARREHVKFLEIDDGIRYPERTVEPALRDAAMQRHLPALEAAAARITAPGFLALVAGAGGLPEFRAHAAPDAHLALAGTLRRPQGR